jgi:ATP-dependent RNA helicase SUPV3L1/SUV3
MPVLPPESAVVLPTPREAERLLLARLGYRAIGPQMVRVDLVERLAKRAFEARAGKAESFVDEALATSLGLRPETVAKLMRDLGFRPAAPKPGEQPGWVWRGQARRRPEPQTDPSHAFAALAGLRRG